MKPQVNRGSDIDHILLFSMFRDRMHKSNLVHVKKYFSNYNTKYWTVFPTPSQEETPLVNLVLQWASLNNLSPSNCALSIQLPARYSYSSSFSTPWRQKIAIIHRETPQPEEFFSTVTEVIFGNCTSFKLHQKVHFIQLTTEPAKYWLFHL